MERKKHVKTIGVVLATTTALQVTGASSQLLNGVPFLDANAETVQANSVVAAGAVTTTPQAVVVMPTYVRIDGTERVGRTLSAELRNDSGKFTTSAGVIYKWYRLSNKHDSISDGKLVGEDNDYELVSSDKDKYIKLVVTYNGQTFQDITTSIDRRSSSSSSSSSHYHHYHYYYSDDNSSKESTEAFIRTNNNGTLSLVNEDGELLTGWQQINGQWYLADETGTAKTGWQQVNGSWYLLKSDYTMAVGWQNVGGTWYLLKSNGEMATGWQQSLGKWYLLNSDGAMVTGWQQVNGKWYYFYNDGSMASNTVINGYRVDVNGVWVK